MDNDKIWNLPLVLVWLNSKSANTGFEADFSAVACAHNELLGGISKTILSSSLSSQSKV